MKNYVVNRLFLMCFLIIAGIAPTRAQMITTIAGNGVAGYNGDNIPAIAAQIKAPFGIVVNAIGDIYFSDVESHVIRKISAAGIISTVAGKRDSAGYRGNGRTATTAIFNNPASMGMDAAGNIYIADYGNNMIRKINTIDTITTVAGTGVQGYSGDGGQAINAKLDGPNIYVDAPGNIYISELNNHRIRKINNAGVITTIAGIGTPGSSPDGTPSTAARMNPTAITVDALGNIYYVDEVNPVYRIIRKIDTARRISTYSNYWAQNMAFGYDGKMYFSDEACYVRKVVYGTAHTYAGNGVCIAAGDSDLAKHSGINTPLGLAFDPAGNLYVVERYGARIRKITAYDPTVGVDHVTEHDGIRVFPNPATDAFTVQLPSGNTRISIVISDLAGRMVETRNVAAGNEVNERFNTSRFPPGAYLIKVTAGDKVYREKVLVR